MQVDKPVCLVNLECGWTNQFVLSCLQVFKKLAWKPSYNRAILKQGIKFS